jgi:hypothetical protein
VNRQSRGQVVLPKQYDPELALASADAFRACSRPFLQRLAGLDMATANEVASKDFGNLVASATTLALSIELYLKVLSILLSATPAHRDAFAKQPIGHDLWALYNRLPLGLQKSIEELYQKVPARPETEAVAFHAHVGLDGMTATPSPSKSPPDNSIRGILKRSRDAFEVWRYFHECWRPGQVVTVHYEFHFLGLIADSLRVHAQDGTRKWKSAQGKKP